jgi:pseudaminic acid cytidylyltransferase
MKVAIIPARGGSKRIPKKNIKLFYGEPIIFYSINAAIQSKLFDKIIVSTDCEEIAKIAKEYGAETPFMRPKEISDDFATTTDVTNHAIKWLKDSGYDCEYVCTIYPTAPLLQEKYLKQAFKQLQNSDAIHAFSATSMPFPIQRTFKIKADGRCKMFWPENFAARSQDLEESYQDAGQFYWMKSNQISDEIMFGKDSIPIILPRHLVQDIDTIEDWKRTELMYKAVQEDK